MLDFSHLKSGVSVICSLALWPIWLIGFWTRLFMLDEWRSRRDFARLAWMLPILLVWLVAAAVLVPRALA